MKTIIAVCLAGLFAVGALPASETSLPQTSEIIEMLKLHFVDKDKLDQKLLNDATAAGILDRLGTGAKLLTADQAASNTVPAVVSTADPSELLARVEVIEPDIAYQPQIYRAEGERVRLPPGQYPVGAAPHGR